MTHRKDSERDINMTVTSKKWRVKKINKKRVMNKIHNIVLGAITGFMSVFFLLPLCVDEVNLLIFGIFILATTWLSLVYYSNQMKDGENMDNYERWERYNDEQERKLEKLPKCDECGERIQTDECYEVNNDLICPNCMIENHRKWVEDYIA